MYAAPLIWIVFTHVTKNFSRTISLVCSYQNLILKYSSVEIRDLSSFGCFFLITDLIDILQLKNSLKLFIAFDKERLHNAVAIENFGLFIDINLPPPAEKLFRGEIIQGEWLNFHRPCALSLAGFASRPGVLPCRVWPSLRVWCAFLSNFGFCFLVYFICSRTRSPVFDCIWWF